jgi:hypothetical protein
MSSVISQKNWAFIATRATLPLSDQTGYQTWIFSCPFWILHPLQKIVKVWVMGIPGNGPGSKPAAASALGEL